MIKPNYELRWEDFRLFSEFTNYVLRNEFEDGTPKSKLLLRTLVLLPYNAIPSLFALGVRKGLEALLKP